VQSENTETPPDESLIFHEGQLFCGVIISTGILKPFLFTFNCINNSIQLVEAQQQPKYTENRADTVENSTARAG